MTVLLLLLIGAVVTRATPQQSSSATPDQRSRYVVYYQRPSAEESTSSQYSRQAQSYVPTRVRPQQDTEDERQQVNYASPVDASRYQSYQGVRANPQYQQVVVQHGRPPAHSPPTRHYGRSPPPPPPPSSGGHVDQQQYLRVPQHLTGTGGHGGAEDYSSLFQRPGDEQQLAYLGQGAGGHGLQSGGSSAFHPEDGSGRSPTRFQYVTEQDARPSGRPGQHGGSTTSGFRPPVFPVEEGSRFPSGFSGLQQQSFGGTRETSGLRFNYPEDAVGGRFTAAEGGLGQFGRAQQFEDLGGSVFGGGGSHFGGALSGRGEASRYGASGRYPFASEATRVSSTRYRDVDEFATAGSSPSEAEIGSDVLLELLKLKEGSELTPQLTSRSQRRFIYVRQ